MSRKILVLILCLMALSIAARSAELRPMVGFLPLQADSGSDAYVFPLTVYWQISLIRGLGVVDMGSMMDCVQLDKLSLPSSAGDATGYSRLARETGVNYVVGGEIENVDRSRVRVRLIIYSASNPRLHPEQVYESAISDLSAVAIRAAKWIASEVGAPVASDVEFDTTKMLPEALRLIDQSARLCIGCEADQSDVNKAGDLADRARTLSSNDRGMVYDWASSISPFQRRTFLRFRHRWGAMRGPHSGWRTSGPVESRPRPRLSTDGRLIWQFADAWQSDLESISVRGMHEDPQLIKSYVEALIARHPRSAYMRYCCGRVLSVVGEGPDMLREYNAAVRLNPDSFRLRMRLISAYMEWHRNGQALTELEAALKRWPNRSEVHLLAASFFRGRKQYDRAVEEVKTAVELDPADLNRRALAEDYLRAGNVVESFREAARCDDGLRKGLVTFSLVLSGVFLLGVLGMVVLVKILMRT